MKRLLLPLLAALALPTAVNANVDPKVAEICMKAVDFQGCVNAMTGQSSTLNSETCNDLKEGLAIVKERLISGTSLTKLDINTNPLSDALAKAKVQNNSNCQKLVDNSQGILEMIRILRNQWDYEISNGSDSVRQNTKTWPSPQIELNVKKFNLIAGGTNPAISGPGRITGFSDTSRSGFDYEMREWRGTLFYPCSIDYCGNYVVKSPMKRMFDVIGLKIDAVIEGREIDWREPPKIIEKVVEEKKKKKKTVRKDASTGSVKINCNSPVWRDKPRCN